MQIHQASQLMSTLLQGHPAQSGLPAIEGYTLYQEIGHGGSGRVYEGVLNATGRAVAIKIYHTRTKNPTAHALHELELLAHVRSSVVPHVLDHGWIDDQAYIVTELIDGQHLLQHAKALDTRGRVGLLAAIADATGTLHASGIIHRDIKPSNILITKAGTPVLIDLGIAELQTPASHDGPPMDPSPKSIAPTGTLDYMCPEQARGENDAVTTRWDVYAIGAVGYHLLTGSPPHNRQGTVSEKLDRSATEPARPPRSLNGDLPKPLASILLKACEHDPAQRYESALHLRDDLQRWLRNEPILAGHQSVWTRWMRRVTRHPIVTISTVACLLMLTFTVLFTILVTRYQNLQPYRFTPQASKQTPITSLESRSGLPIHTWQTNESNGIRHAGSIVSGSDQRYAILGLEKPDIESGHVGLVAYTLGHYDTPAWTATQMVPGELAYSIRNDPGPHQFKFRDLIIEDIFPERPGPEIVSTHIHSLYSLCAIQIHTPEGELLSEYYHDGWVRGMYWNPVTRMLVLTAQNSDGLTTDRGAPTLWVGKYPVVVFGIRPKIGETAQPIQHTGIDLGETGYTPEWYKCLLPGSAYTHLISSTTEVDIHPHKPGLLNQQLAGYTAIQLGGTDNPGKHITLLIDEHGEVVTVTSTDTYSPIQDGFVPEKIILDELPARTNPRRIWP